MPKDERESGLRESLNSGHTFAHGFEAATGCSSLLHGEAVAAGMVMAVLKSLCSARVSVRIEGLPPGQTGTLSFPGPRHPG